MEHDHFLECLRLYEALDAKAAHDIALADTDNYEFYPTHLGEENLVVKLKGRDFFVHSPQGAKREAKNWFKAINLDSFSLVYIFGIGLGYYYDEIRAWLHAEPGRVVIFLENDLSALKMLFRTKKGLEILKDDRVIIKTFAIVNNRPEITPDPQCSLLFSALHEKKYVLTALNSYSEQKNPIFLGIKSQIYISTTWHRNIHGDKLTYLTSFTDNIISNLLRVESEYSIEPLIGAFKGVPAIIAGAGPSVMKDIHLFEEAKKRCLLIGSGTGTNVLNSQGILPHFFVGIDPTESQESRVRMNSSFLVPCFHKPRFSAAASRFATGPKVYLKGCFSPFSTQWFEDAIGITQSFELDAGISSTTFALDIASILGCNPIILSGLDLAYTDKKRYPEVLGSIVHGKRSVQDELGFISQTPLIDQGYDGQEVLTKIDWLVECQLVSTFKRAHPDITLYNATRGGLKIHRVPNLFLDKFLEPLKEEYDIEGMLHASIQAGAIAKESKRTPLEVVSEWHTFIEHFREEIQEEKKEWQSRIFREDFSPDHVSKMADCFIQNFKENPFFSTFLKSHEELMSGKVFLPAAALRRVHAEGRRDLFRPAAEDFSHAFFSFWEEVAEDHLKGVRESLSRYRQEEAWIGECIKTASDADAGQRQTVECVEKTDLKKVGDFVFEKAEKDNGILDGCSLYFGTDGTLLSKTQFSRGNREGEQLFFHSSGALFAKRWFEKGKLHGIQRYFFEQGALKAELSYHLGKLNGDAILYYRNGRTKRHLQFIDGKLSGFEKFWNEAGTLLFSASYLAGKPLGESFEYYPDGTLERKTVFDKDGRRLSIEEWDKEGKPVKEESVQAITAVPEQLKDAIGEYLTDMEKMMHVFGDERNRHFY